MGWKQRERRKNRARVIPDEPPIGAYERETPDGWMIGAVNKNRKHTFGAVFGAIAGNAMILVFSLLPVPLVFRVFFAVFLMFGVWDGGHPRVLLLWPG